GVALGPCARRSARDVRRGPRQGPSRGRAERGERPRGLRARRRRRGGRPRRLDAISRRSGSGRSRSRGRRREILGRARPGAPRGARRRPGRPEVAMRSSRSTVIARGVRAAATPLAIATLALALASTSFAPRARSATPPSAWDIAKDPAERDRWALHVRVERLMHPPVGEGGLRFDDELRLEAACAMLEEAHAAHSPDVRLRFDLGIVYSELATRQRRNDLQEKVIAVLAPVLESAQGPDDGAATAALEAL